MKLKFVFACALIGAVASFNLNAAQASSPTNLVELLKSKDSKAVKKSDESKKSVKTNKQAQTKTTAKAKYLPKPKVTKKSAVKQSKPSNTRYSSIINHYASTYGVNSALAHAVVRHESNFQPHVRGRAGEIGLMQIKLSTARGLGYTGSAKGLYEPSTNVQYGMKYLAQAQKLGGGSVCGTILKYNAGHGAKRMNPTSAKYCSNVQAYMRSF
ncbi:transglycosylase SLT domain-containing protein [Paenochrobactrum sp. BZR 588]|uniref:lytic transglycosylase domain-containing protein n=1 Tax=unclassified Paenochrobactrum TaxID=2639760 RepID=UPI0038521F3F